MAFQKLDYERSKTDLCLYFKWDKAGLIMWLSWADNCLVIGMDNKVKVENEKIKELFDCGDLKEFMEFLSCNVEVNQDE